MLMCAVLGTPQCASTCQQFGRLDSKITGHACITYARISFFVPEPCACHPFGEERWQHEIHFLRKVLIMDINGYFPLLCLLEHRESPSAPGS